MRRPERPTRRALALGLPLLPLVAAGSSRQASSQSAPAAAAVEGSFLTVVLVRHAEKDPAGDPEDPGLSERGRQRAEALSRLLGRAGATHLFASRYRRTKDTLAPLAALSGLSVEVAPDVINRVRLLPGGSVAVVAGHSNTVPAIAAALGAKLTELEGATGAPSLRDDEYGRLFVIAFYRSGAATPRAALVELAYGE